MGLSNLQAEPKQTEYRCGIMELLAEILLTSWPSSKIIDSPFASFLKSMLKREIICRSEEWNNCPLIPISYGFTPRA